MAEMETERRRSAALFEDQYAPPGDSQRHPANWSELEITRHPVFKAEEKAYEELFGMYERDCDGSLDLAEFELLLAVVLEREAAQSGPDGTG